MGYRGSCEYRGVRPDGGNEDLSVHDLRGVKVEHLPHSFCVYVPEPTLGFSAIDAIWFVNKTNRCVMDMRMLVCFDQFHLPCNLIHFMQKLASAILASDEGIRFTSGASEREEGYGVRINVTADLAPEDELSDVATRAGAIVLECYKRRVQEVLTDGKSNMPTGPGVIRWWTKEFIVPLATSGVLGGLITWLISRAG